MNWLWIWLLLNLTFLTILILLGTLRARIEARQWKELARRLEFWEATETPKVVEANPTHPNGGRP